MKDILILSPSRLDKIDTTLEYDNIWAETENISGFFNSKRELAKQYRAVLFLDGRYKVRNRQGDSVIDLMYNQLMVSSPMIAGLYSDTVLQNNDIDVSFYTNLSYSPILVSNGIFVDSSLMIKSSVFPVFDEQLTSLMIFDALIGLAATSPVCRCPYFCFNRNLDCSIPLHELEYIGKKRYGSK